MATNITNSNHMQVEDWINDTGSLVASGDIVVMGALGDAILGVALADIAIAGTGPVGINCEVTAAKVSAAVFTQGESLSWDSSASAFDDNAATAASGDVADGASRAAANGASTETSCQVWLTGNPGALTA